MITFKDYFFYTYLLNPGTLVCLDNKYFKGVTKEEYKKIEEDVKKKGVILQAF